MSIQNIIFALNDFDGMPFGEADKALDKMMTDAEKALKEREALLAALDGMVLVYGRTGDALQDFEEQAAVYYAETGRMRPGKDISNASSDQDDYETRRVKYLAWVQEKFEAGRKALTDAQVPA